ncbi:ATPase AAA [Pseudoscardovia radai]|uniref:ATP-dependent zinc metalloprotease FtsH n=1 Tax=Pseudoscardovia radai TaxID=987066 RepID=A0A261EZK2_9BIFI|nr:ATP-dependent zinc metalloprotease FtsH [Pseudoscardovia radai]OZG52106.1 ATPase AAA [Pseudoscardovia radai]
MTYPSGPNNGRGGGDKPDNGFDPFSDMGNNDNDNKNRKKRPWWRIPWVWVAVIVVLILAAFQISSMGNPRLIDTKDGLQLLRDGKATYAQIDGGRYLVKLDLSDDFSKTDRNGQNHNYGKNVQFYYVFAQGEEVVSAVENADLKDGYTSTISSGNSVVEYLITTLIPFVIIFFAFWWLLGRMQGGAGGALFGGKSGSKKLGEGDTPKTKFKDVAGEDAAVQEVEEIKDFLKDPAKYQKLGARIPRGVLLYGPPGTGKTLLARAIAGEAGVPFYSMAGSDFVEMFVGLGASRVRDLFDEAKKNAPAIIFIDEIDAVGRRRGNSANGGVDEREQTLNQLLVEMDGFDNDTSLIVIAATNRPDVLDPALLRPGRFDRQVAVEAPDLAGREAILKVHAKGKPFVPDVDLHQVAVRTPGFTGADLANVLNEAALLTARSNAQLIDNRAIDEAIDRVMSGPRRRSTGMAAEELRNTAYHEGGHALVAAALRHTDPVTKVTILPRGRALGYTMVMPTSDRYSETRNQLLDQLAYAMGGRTAEEIVFHDPTTGASNDIEKATDIARQMVLEDGFSRKLGSVKWGDAKQEDGIDGLQSRRFSEETLQVVDQEVHDLLENAHTEAWQIINENRDILDELVRQLLVKETLNEKELAVVFKDVRKAPERQLWLSNDQRPLSDKPPVPIPESLRRSLQSSAEREAEGGDGADAGTGAGAGAAGAGAPGAGAAGQAAAGQAPDPTTGSAPVPGQVPNDAQTGYGQPASGSAPTDPTDPTQNGGQSGVTGSAPTQNGGQSA